MHTPLRIAGMAILCAFGWVLTPGVASAQFRIPPDLAPKELRDVGPQNLAGVSIHVTPGMIADETPIYVGITQTTGEPLKLDALVLSNRYNLLILRPNVMFPSNSSRAVRIGTWSQVKNDGTCYVVLSSGPKGPDLSEAIDSMGVRAKAVSYFAEFRVDPGEGDKFEISYKVNYSCTVTLKSLAGAIDEVWKSDPRTCVMNDSHSELWEWDAALSKPGMHQIHWIAVPPGDTTPYPETKSVTVKQ